MARGGSGWTRALPYFEYPAVFLGAFFYLLWRAPALEFYLGSADHGFQLALGAQVLLGKTPFKDLFFHYGPLTAYASALGISVSGSLVGETVICAIGYASSILLLYRTSKWYSNRLASALLAIVGLAFLARFYKWYYWLFPLLSTFLFHLYVRREDLRYRLAWIAGLSSGTAWLFRFDLGLATVACTALAMSARRLFGTASASKPESESESDPVSAHLVRLLAGFAAPITAWLVVVAWVGGGRGIHHYVLATWEGALGAARGMSTPAPRFVWEMPLSSESATALLFLLVPLTYLACLALHVERFRRHNPAYSWAAAYTALTGLAIFPQALHRADGQHLLQVIPPFFLAGLILYRRLELSHRPAAVACLAAITVAVAPSASEGAVDLGHWYRNPLWTYGSLARVLEAETTHSNAPLLRAVRRHVPHDRPILVADVVTDSQFYYFAERRTSGVVVVYAPGVLDSPWWRRLEIERILDDPPAAVIVPSSSKSEAARLLASRQPEVARFVRNYTRVLYTSTDWKLLVRP